MDKQLNAHLVSLTPGFDYSLLKPSVANQIRTTADNIREKIKQTLEDIIEVGHDLWRVKQTLSHGQFGPWLLAEFGWSDRTARNFMAVAEQFGPKREIISDLHISPTAAYLLAAPAVPFEARQVALDRAQSGEKITVAVAKEILGKARKSKPRRAPVPWRIKWQRLTNTFDRFRENCNPKDVAKFAQQLRRFANTLR